MNKRITVNKDKLGGVLMPETLSTLGAKLGAVVSADIEMVGHSLIESAARPEGLRAVYLFNRRFPAAGWSQTAANGWANDTGSDSLSNKVIHGFASGLVANGVAAEVWCEGERDSQTVAAEGYRIRCFAAGADNTPRLATALHAHIETLHPEHDLAVLYGEFHPSLFAIARRLKALDIPYVVAQHGARRPESFHLKSMQSWSSRATPIWPIWKASHWFFLERSVLQGALAVQELGKPDQQAHRRHEQRHETWARRLGIAKPTVAIESGFLDGEIPPAQALRWRTRGAVRALYWGRVDVHSEGLDALLNGFNRIARRGRGVTPALLTLQGPDGAGETPRVKRMVGELNEPDEITVLPPVRALLTARTLMSHDVVCMPSHFDGFDFAALEAMLAARVLLVARSSHMAPHIEQSGCGVVVDSDADAIERGFQELLLQRHRWCEMGLRGRGYALANLHWHRIVARTVTHYRELLARLPRAAGVRLSS